MRVAIAGCPRAGKTTLGNRLASELGVTAQHADDLIALGWSEASDELARRMQHPGPWLIEGVAVIRALRKALSATSGKPCDRLLWMAHPREPLSDGQRRMFEQDARRFAELRSELQRRGVEVVTGTAPRKTAPMPEPVARMQPAQDDSPALIEADDSGTRWGDYGGRGFG